MAKNNNVETHKKNTKIENEKSSELKPKETTKKKKLRLHSHLRVNIPLFQSLMMILPSLAKHAEATEESGHTAHDNDLTTTNSVADETIVDKHVGATPLEAAHPNTQTNENQESPNTNESQIPHGANTHLVPSHHLSTLSHPQVHYIPSVSMPTISAGGNGQPTHSNTPPTPTTPVTFTPEVIKGTYGELHVDVNGQYTFVLNPNSPQYILLNQHQQGTDHFALHLSNGASIVVQIPVTGKQDLPSISGDLTGVVTEDHNIDSQGLLHANGKIDVVDPDQNESSVTPEVISGKYGSLTIDANGHWQYQVNNSLSNVQALTGATSLHENFTIHTKDGMPQTIDMTIGGNDDNAVITGMDAGSVIEDLTTQVQGQLSVTDPDLGEDHFQASQINGHLGTLTIDKDGAWTYDLDNTNPTVQVLGKGATATDIITVHSADGTAHQVTITINGTNDRPTISGTSSGAVIEQGLSTTGNPDATGSLIATDIDKSDNVTWAINQPQGQWGRLSIDQHGHWHYQLDNSTGGAADKLAAGEHQSESFWITATDSAGATVPHKIVIDVQGSNDKPIVSAWTQLPAGKEDQPVTIKASDLLTHASDVDSSDVLHVTNLQATHGSLTDNKDGTYTFTPDKDFNGEIRLTYDVVDGHGGSVSTQAKFDLTATPDNAIITDAQTNAGLRGVTEDRGYIDTHYQLHYDGRLNIQDPDAGEAQFDPNIGPQTYQGIGYDTKLGGHILLMRDGHYTYTLDNRNIQNLAQGEVKHDSAVIRSADGTTHTIELTVHGTNDAPTINAQSHSVTEGGSVLNGQMVGQDIDTGAALTYSAPQIDGLVVNPDGSYSFNPAHSSYQSLASGVTKTLTVPVTVTDEHNASSTQNISITITGVNNSSVIGGVDTGDVTEGNAGQDMSPDYAQPGMAHLVRSTIRTSGKLSISDTDTGEAEFDTHGLGFNYSGQYGDLLLRKDGTWFYHADTGQIRSTGGLTSTRGTAIDQLGENQTLTDTITVYSKDGTSHDIVITIHGSNDQPYCASEVQLNSGKEDLAQTITATELIANTVDVDANDAGKLTIANLHADHGSIQDNHDGTFTFTPSHNYNGSVHFTYDVKDAHGGVTATGANLHLQATGDAATITGVDHGNVTEDRGYIDTQYNLHFDGKLDIVDPDQGEAQFDIQRGHTYHGIGYDTKMGGWVLLQQDGAYTYTIDNRKPEIQNLGSTETLVDKVTIHSVDGTSHEIQITIHGTNDDPKVSAVTTLPAGTEDTDVVLHASDLLANATDIDHNDVGKLSVANLIADHGNITDNHDGTFTFHPSQDYNGKVSFTYDVQDAHGGSVSTSASITLAPTRDSAVISGDNTGTIIEDHNVGHSSLHPVAASGLLRVTDPDAGQDHFQVNRLLGEQAIHDPFGGFLRITPNGAWGYEVANSRLQSLAEGEVEKVVYRVYSADHTAHDITITVTGTNDRPTITATTLAHGTEDTHYQMQSSQFGFTDIDTGDTLNSIAITDLPPATQGKFVLDGHDITAGQSIAASDIAKLQFIPTPNFNGDVQFKFTVNDGHEDSLEATNILHIDAVGDKAVISGVDTGDVYENKNPDMSPDFAQPGIAHLTNSMIHVEGQLTIIDPDTGENSFDSKGIGYTYHGKYGHLILNTDGKWFYGVATGTADVNGGLTTKVGSTIDQLGANETLTDTITIQSKDGTTHDIVITIHGDNDRPYCSSEVQLNSGKEDTQVTLTVQELLVNTIDVDANDVGKLSITNLLVDHGSVVDNKDGTYTFTPTKDYNGHVHFSYDVTDAHGGVTHTGASTTLLSSNDAATLQPTLASNFVTEDHLKSGTSTNELWSGWKNLDIQDIDSPSEAKVTQIEVNGVKHTVPANFAMNLAGAHGTFNFTHSTDGHDKWSYSADNSHAEVQSLSHGDSLTDTITLITADGTRIPLTAKILGTDDHVIIDTPDALTAALGTAIEDKVTSISGTLLAHDSDSKDSVTFNAGNSVGTYGTLHVDSNGQWHYDLDHFKANALQQGETKAEGFDITAISTDGSTATKHIEVLVQGNDDGAIISGQDSGQVTEDKHLQTSGNLTVTDPDSGEGHFTATSGSTQLGTYTIDASGHWTYSLDPRVQSLHQGETTPDVFTVHSADGTAHVIKVTITGTQDAPIITGQSTGAVYEDSQTSVSGTLNADDKDYGQSGFWAQSHIASTHNWGDLSIDQNGYWTFHLDSTNPAVNSLGEHDTIQETVTVNTIDGTSKVIQITIHGTNDDPVLSVTQTTPTTGTLTETDVDVNDTHTFSVVNSTGQFGTLSVDPDSGAYIYTANGSVAGMSYNAATHTYHGTDVFEVKVADNHGGESSKFITFDPNGHVSVVPGQSPTISTSVPSNPLVTTTQPSLPIGTNTPPNNAVTVDLAASSDTGTSDTDNLTKDSTPTITGHTDIPYSQVTIYDGSKPIGHAVSDGSGQYSVAVSSLSNGDHNLSAKAVAPSSVMSATSSPLSVHIDTQVHVGIQTDPITADNVINAQESNRSIDITGSVSGDFNTGDIVTLDVNGTQHTGVVDAKGHYSIAVPGSELIADADQKIEASVAVTDTAGNSAHATADVTYQVDTQVSVPTITFENAGADNLYSKAEIARGQANTITATVTPPSDAKIGEHLVVNGQDHVLDAHTLQHGIQIEVHPGSNVQATMTDEHGNTAGSQGFAASAIPEPIIVRPPSGSHQVSGTLGVPPLLPSLTPVPTAQSGWRIHLPNGQYVTSHHGQYGTLTIDPQTGHLHYQEQAQVHTGPHGSASGIGQHEDKFEVALQGTNQDEVVAHVNIQILSHGPGHSGKLTVGTEVVDMTITPLVHTSHPAPPPPPPVQHDEPDMASQADFTVTLSDDSNLDLTQQTHQEPDQKTDHHGAAAYLDALGIKPDATSTTVHDQPADIDIVLAQVDQPDAVTHDQAHLDMSDAQEHHDANINHNQDDEHHHHNDVDGLPDIDPNS
ncbi:VCBS domain-containing protein [Vibrio splendidus]|uniref:Cadherin domain-containing protein n=1 Tax=Vibrio splendidus 12E03 TaxID=1191305 RepID=A0A1E5FU79_VIBSP|nr:VCBS domain-containing protein [Vibrio splendidus]OEF94081.1 hypothetical protein A142_18620 [Vibrio splendidus 12E03]